MKIKYKVIEFKTVSPLFEMERDGVKPFTTRLVDRKDQRFRALSQWSPFYKTNWLIKIINPQTHKYFYRKLIGKQYVPGPLGSILGRALAQHWLILYLGDKIGEE